eukprot:1158834-Pelagomonas_calceolata.AAC.3
MGILEDTKLGISKAQRKHCCASQLSAVRRALTGLEPTSPLTLTWEVCVKIITAGNAQKHTQ